MSTTQINPTQTMSTEVNGVNVTQMMQTIDTVKETPTRARFEFRARNQWIDGGLNRSTIDGFYGAGEEHTTATYVFDNDEPPVLLGHDRGANPVEYLLHALAGCLTTSLVYHAAAQGIHVESVESKLEGDLDLQGFLGIDPSVRRGYQGIRVSMKVKADAPDATVEKLVQAAQQFSPVFDSITNPVPVTVTLER